MLRQASRPYQPLWPALSALATGEVADLERPEWLSQLPADDREKGVRFVDTVESLRRRRAGLDLAGLVEAAVSETGYDLANLVRDPSADGIAAVRRVGSLAREYETAEGRSLRGFLDWSNLSEELDSEAAAATADEASDVVRIMTVHAAKGLQFKVTCVPDLGRDCGGKHDHAVRLGRSSARDPEEFKLGLRIPRFNGDKITAYDWEELAELERLANEDEELRLLHVAITRAEDHLVLSGILPEKPPGKGISHASPMIVRIAQEFGFDPRSPEEWKTKLGMAGDAGDGISVIHNIADEATAARLATVRPPVAVASETAPGEPPLSRPEAKVYPDVPLSFTAFSEFAECPARFYAKRVLRIDLPGEWARPSSPELEPMTGRSRGTRFGSAVHDVLEGLAKDGWREPSGDRISEALIHRGLGTGPGSEGDVELASRMITGFLGSELGQRVAAGKAAPEVPLIVRYEKVTIRGSADLILEGETPLVIDYKTNRLDGSSPGEKMKDYELQRGLYALALARARNLGAVDTAYVFLGAPEQPVFKTLGTDDFALIESLLKRTLAEITAGRFFGGPGAANQPCGEPDCIGCQVLTAQIERAAAEGR
jgi:ATP-dependent helicase/nuclease subunit A